jgi:hypothetical protein
MISLPIGTLSTKLERATTRVATIETLLVFIFKQNFLHSCCGIDVSFFYS